MIREELQQPKVTSIMDKERSLTNNWQQTKRGHPPPRELPEEALVHSTTNQWVDNNIPPKTKVEVSRIYYNSNQWLHLGLPLPMSELINTELIHDHVRRKIDA